jgi:hypothetical protein
MSEEDKQYIIRSFSILGVQGFKAPCVRESNPVAGINTAIARLFLAIDHMEKSLHGVPLEDPARQTSLRAAYILQYICAEAFDNDHNVLVPGEVIQTLSAQQFMDDVGTVYSGNFDLFMSSLDAIKDGLDVFRKHKN